MYVTGKEALNPEFSLLNLYLYSLVLKMSVVLEVRWCWGVISLLF